MERQNRFLLLSAFCFLIFFVILFQVVYAGPMVNFDNLVHASISPTHGFLWDLSLFFHYIFGTLGFSLISLILLVSFLFEKKHSHSLFVLGSVVITLGLTYVVKHIVARIRPENLIEIGKTSFPSGHSIQSFMIVAIFFYLFAYNIINIHIKRIWASLGVLIILLTAFSRLYLQAHWFSDILGAWALGLAIFGLMVYLHEKFKWIDKKEIGF